MPRPFYLPLVEPGVLFSLKATKTPPAWHQAGGCHTLSMEPGPPARVCLSHKHGLYQDHVENRPPCNAQEDVVLPLMEHPHKEDA